MLKITYVKDGPAIVYCDMDVQVVGIPDPALGVSKANVRLMKAAICRCGMSENGYTCDGSHAKEAPPLRKQIDRLASFIMKEIPGEPAGSTDGSWRGSEGAVDAAIRIMRRDSVPKDGPEGMN